MFVVVVGSAMGPKKKDKMSAKLHDEQRVGVKIRRKKERKKKEEAEETYMSSVEQMGACRMISSMGLLELLPCWLVASQEYKPD